MTGFGLPRALAALSLTAAVLALTVWPFVGYGWRDSAGLLCLTIVAGWLSHDTARIVRRRLALERAIAQRQARIDQINLATASILLASESFRRSFAKVVNEVLGSPTRRLHVVPLAEASPRATTDAGQSENPDPIARAQGERSGSGTLGDAA